MVCQRVLYIRSSNVTLTKTPVFCATDDFIFNYKPFPIFKVLNFVQVGGVATF
jgi:hypothetical protein